MENNLRAFREKYRYTLEFVASQIGMTRQNYWFVENKNRRITLEQQQKLGELFNCSVKDLYNENLDVNNIDNNEMTKLIPIKYFDLSASAGYGCFLDNEKSEKVNIGEDFLNKIGITNYNNISIIKAKGDSMFPTILNNDFLFVDTSKKEIYNNKIYMINEEGLLKVKRIIKDKPSDTTITIKSDNEVDGEYKPYPLKIYDCKNKICGMVVFYCRSLC